ncbi:MAG: agmatine deiminase family protein [Gammaproteobacteria bacterium]
MPAEWEPHRATWLAWPHNRDSWPGNFEPVEPVLVKAVCALAGSEAVYIDVLNAAHECDVRRLLEAANCGTEVRFHHIATNDAWRRDHGAIFVTRDTPGVERLAAIDWEYNAWGGKYPPYDLDNAVPKRMAEILGVRCFKGGMVLEGGSIDVNGRGLLLTTEACLLNPNRNPELSRAAIERRLCETLGVHTILWLGEGIVGDDTDGHIDDITRFVAEDTVVTVVEEDPNDANFGPLQENLGRLQTMTDEGGKPLKVVALPMPSPVIYRGQRLPASYANFYIANRVILLPGFNDPNDEVARITLQRLFPDRRVVVIDCTDLIWGLGAFHCLTQQVPA